MFSIQGLLHFFKDRVCGLKLEYPSYSYGDLFQTTYCQITNVDCLNFKFSGLFNDEKNEKKGYSHILFMNNYAF